MAVYGYVRVSTVRQTAEGESLEVQQRTIAGYALMRGMVVDRVFVERAVSGSTPLADRPQGAALLALVQPGDAIITAKLDRMFRSALDALDVLGRLRERDIALHMVDLGGDVSTNGVSKLVFTILSAVAEAERDRTRERVAEVKRDQRMRNRYLGGTPPFGWRVGADGELVPDPDQQQALGQMRELRAQGLSLRGVAERMVAAGVSVSHVGVKNALAAPIAHTEDQPGRLRAIAAPTAHASLNELMAAGLSIREAVEHMDAAAGRRSPHSPAA